MRDIFWIILVIRKQNPPLILSYSHKALKLTCFLKNHMLSDCCVMWLFQFCDAFIHIDNTIPPSYNSYI